MTIKIGLSFISFVVLIIVISASLLLYFYSKQNEVISMAMYGLGLNEAEELVVAELTTTEAFSKTEYNYFFKDFPFGHTGTTISLVAHYKYYLKLSELSYDLKGDTLIFKFPKLYPSLPIAFEINSLQEECQSHFFAPDCKQSLQHLKSEINQKMPQFAKLHAPIVYDKASKSLADIFYNFLDHNSYPIGFSKIMVVIGEENSNSKRIFSYDSNCWLIECLTK